MTDKILLERLIAEKKAHGKIIVGVDFDNTVFPLNKLYTNSCEAVRSLLILLKKNNAITICLWTTASSNDLEYKKFIMEHYGLKPDFVNESPVKLGNGDKPYFNIVLDDRSGLGQAFSTLSQFYNLIEKKK